MEPLFADLDVAGKAGQYVMYVLAVAGGYLIGNLFTLLICRVMAKLVFKKHMNLKFERALRIVGGIVVAALIAFLLFRFGHGWGLGGSGSGEGQGSGGQTPNITDPAKDSPRSDLSPRTIWDFWPMLHAVAASTLCHVHQIPFSGGYTERSPRLRRALSGGYLGNPLRGKIHVDKGGRSIGDLVITHDLAVTQLHDRYALE